METPTLDKIRLKKVTVSVGNTLPDEEYSKVKQFILDFFNITCAIPVTVTAEEKNSPLHIKKNMSLDITFSHLISNTQRDPRTWELSNGVNTLKSVILFQTEWPFSFPVIVGIANHHLHFTFNAMIKEWKHKLGLVHVIIHAEQSKFRFSS